MSRCGVTTVMAARRGRPTVLYLQASYGAPTAVRPAAQRGSLVLELGVVSRAQDRLDCNESPHCVQSEQLPL